MSALPILPAVGDDRGALRAPATERPMEVLAPVIEMPVRRRRERTEVRRGASRPGSAGARRVSPVVESAGVSHESDVRESQVGRRTPLSRVLAFAGALTLATTLAVAGGIALQPEAYSGPTFTHAVVAGESVWGLAEGLGLQRPVDQVVLDIQALNGITSNGLVAGQQVILPTE